MVWSSLLLMRFALVENDLSFLSSSLECIDWGFTPLQVAWLYNIRGTDVAYCPVVHAFAILTTDSAFLYVDKKKVSDEVWLLFLFSENMPNCAIACSITSEFSMF